MTQILLLTSSPRGEASYSTQVAATLADRLTQTHPGAVLASRDLARRAPGHLDGQFLAALGTSAEDHSAAQKVAMQLADDLIAELKAADIVVIAAPMINFTVPTTLKAWIDCVLRAGTTFRYTDKGPEGLVKGKKAYVVTAKGGIYSTAPANDFLDPYLTAVLSFIGITDVDTITVEGVAYGPEAAEQGLAAAIARLDRLVPAPVA